MSSNGKLGEISKFLSYVLRHKPEDIGLSLDTEGWANLRELIACAAQAGKALDMATIKQVLAAGDKKRFALSEDRLRIRALQGHSVEHVTIGHPEMEPPEWLYHGTATRFLPAIFEKGLIAGRRHHVHLSQDPETAITVGQRHGKPAVLIVMAGEMHREGRKFFRAGNGVWLTNDVPPTFLKPYP